MIGNFGLFHVGAIFNFARILIGVVQPVLCKCNCLKLCYRWRLYFGLLAAEFAEAGVRIPALEVHTAPRGFEVAISPTLAVRRRLLLRRHRGRHTPRA